MNLWPLPALSIAIGAALPLSIAATNILLALLTFFVFLRRPIPWRALKNPAIYALLVYWGIGFICAARGMDTRQSLAFLFHKDLHKIWALGILLMAFEAEPSPQALAGLAVGFAIAAGIGIGQTLPHIFDFPLWKFRAHAFIHPVAYGNLMTWGLLGGLCFWRSPETGLERSQEKRLAKFFTALAALALIFNQTRGALFGFIAGCFILAFYEPRFRSPKLWGTALATGLAMFFARANSVPGHIDASIPSHFILWKTAIAIFRDHPWTGVGPNNFQLAYPLYHGELSANTSVWNAAHNLYLHQMAERGLLGLAALAAVMAALTIPAWKSVRENPGFESLWAWGGLAAFWVMNLTEVSFQTEQTATLVFFIWAWSLANSRHKEGAANA